MGTGFIDQEALRAFPLDEFRAMRPFPWFNFQGFLTADGFRALNDAFPPLELFEEHRDIKRAYGQRPHDRYYLAYDTSIYHQDDSGPGRGVIKRGDLPEPWRVFMDELEGNELYASFVREALGVSGFRRRYAWHIGFAGSEVSPHVDAPEKFGTHIMYFNTSEEWDPEWGGETLVLGGKTTESMSPDFADFAVSSAAQIVDNRSFFFRNTPDAWHGARSLTCPAGKYRRLFNVIFESAEVGRERSPYLTAPPASRRLLDRARALLKR